MSDPVTNTEIEDVLTSIRRLVSENRKPAHAAAPAAVSHGESETKQLESEHPPAPPALVLTPALRVADAPQEAKADVADDAVNDDESLAAWDDADDGADAVIGADLQEEAAEDFDAGADEAVAAWEEDVPDAVAELSDDDGGDWRDEEADAAQEVDEAETAADTGPWEEPEEVFEAPDARDAEEWRDAFEDAQEDHDGDVEGNRAEAEEAPDAVAEEEVPFDFQQVLDARIVQWREGEPEFGPEEPDAPGDSDYAGTETVSTGWSAAPSEADVDAEAKTFEQALQDEFIEEVEATVMPELADGVDEAAVIDEEMLREMVADIVRQELQGALGERITRNVRKLVRREIHRALAAHDLD